MPSRASALLRLAATTSFAALALVVAWTRIPVPEAVDWREPRAWLAAVGPETALVALGRVVVVVGATWVLATTLAHLAVTLGARVGRLPRLCTLVGRLTARLAPRASRHAVEALLAVGLAAGPVAARPAPAGTTGPARDPVAPLVAVGERPGIAPLEPVRDGRIPEPGDAPPGPATPESPPVSTVPPVTPPPSASPSPTTVRAPRHSVPAPTGRTEPTGPTVPPPAPATPSLRPAPVPAPGRPGPRPAPAVPPGAGETVHVVEPGESLWTIAAQRLHTTIGPVDDATLDRYWRDLCDRNREGLASGDVDLVYPGEEIHLPPVA